MSNGQAQMKPTFDNKVSIINVVLPPGFGHFIYWKINGKCVNIFQHWYTCCTVAHVFYVNMLPRGSSLKTDVKFNTCLINKINVRFFVKCQLLFNGLFLVLFEKKKTKKKNRFNYFAMEKKIKIKYTFDSGYKQVPSTLKGKLVNLFSEGFLCFFSFFCSAFSSIAAE